MLDWALNDCLMQLHGPFYVTSSERFPSTVLYTTFSPLIKTRAAATSKKVLLLFSTPSEPRRSYQGQSHSINIKRFFIKSKTIKFHQKYSIKLYIYMYIYKATSTIRTAIINIKKYIKKILNQKDQNMHRDLLHTRWLLLLSEHSSHSFCQCTVATTHSLTGGDTKQKLNNDHAEDGSHWATGNPE